MAILPLKWLAGPTPLGHLTVGSAEDVRKANGMLGLRSGCEPLNKLLAPIAYYLDQCWWFYGGQYVKLAATPHGSHHDPKFAAAWASYREEAKRRGEELDTFTTYCEVGRIGWPGFFTRFAGGLGSDWSFYFASDAQDDLPIPSFRAAAVQGLHWFEPPENLPADICVFVRGIDAGYWMFSSVTSGCLRPCGRV